MEGVEALDYLSRAGAVTFLVIVAWAYFTDRIPTRALITRYREENDDLKKRVASLEERLDKCVQREQERGNEWRIIAEEAKLQLERATGLLKIGRTGR